MRTVIDRIWNLAAADKVGKFF
ncbi:MAG: hypothetical protein V7606_1199, partial [Burkholderiales bacterium]